MNLHYLTNRFISITSLTALCIVGTIANISPATAQTLVAISPDGELSEYRNRTTPILSLGSASKHVAEVQLILQELGFYDGQISSLYNPKMVAAVKEFQTSRNINVTGIVSTQTWQALINAEQQAQNFN